MAEQVKVSVLRNVPVSDDGIRSRMLVRDTDDTVPADLFEGLRNEGYVRRADGESSSAGDGDVTVVDIPVDWQTLHHATKKKLAREISGAEPADTGSAEAVIEAELARRAAEQTGE